MYAVDFDYRSDGGPTLIGPFATKEAGDRWVGTLELLDCHYQVRPMHVPEVW